MIKYVVGSTVAAIVVAMVLGIAVAGLSGNHFVASTGPKFGILGVEDPEYVVDSITVTATWCQTPSSCIPLADANVSVIDPNMGVIATSRTDGQGVAALTLADIMPNPLIFNVDIGSSGYGYGYQQQVIMLSGGGNTSLSYQFYPTYTDT